MSFDLYLWRTEAGLTDQEAHAQYVALATGPAPKPDPELAAFARHLARAIGGGVEVTVGATHVAVFLPWSRVETLALAARNLAWSHGLTSTIPRAGP